MALAWPAVLKPSSTRFRLMNGSVSGGPAADGSEQIIAGVKHHWLFKGTFPLHGRADRILAMESLLTAMDGRANAVLVPAFTGWLQSWPTDAQDRILTPGFVKRFQKHLRGTAYEQSEVPVASEIIAIANESSTGAGSVTLEILISQGGDPLPGQLFGIGEYLYRILEVVAHVTAGVYTLTFRPRLRATVLVTTPVLFTRPVCRMKALSDDLGPDQLEAMRFGELTLEMREDH